MQHRKPTSFIVLSTLTMKEWCIFFSFTIVIFLCDGWSVDAWNGCMGRRECTTTLVTSLISLEGTTDTTNTAFSDTVFLKDATRTKFPLVAFGLQIYDDATAYRLTRQALEVGYRNFFASVLAGNQRGFAQAVRDSGVDRKDLFICGSVVSNRADGFEKAKKSTTVGWQRNLEAFSVGNIDYLDQILLDYPGPNDESILGQWAAFADMMDQGYTKTLAVSNFSPSQLGVICSPSDSAKSHYNPVVNQLPFNVAYHPGNVMEENANFGVLVQAWAPLGGSTGGFNPKIKAICKQVGQKYQKSGPQVALRWIIQKAGAVCTQTTNKEHFVEDLNIFDFQLSSDDLATLDAMA
jgi:diketogulonate reductase-like aldo/keto reductase